MTRSALFGGLMTPANAFFSRTPAVSQHPHMNANQVRHITAYLHLLVEELTVERTFLPPGADGDARRAALDAVAARIRELLAEMHLKPVEPPAPGRRLWALAETWLSRVEDLRGRGLVPYGPVPESLTKKLDPPIDRLADALRDLSAAARGEA